MVSILKLTQPSDILKKNCKSRLHGKWFFTKYENQAKKKIYFVDYENQAELKVFFVEYENQAGWRNKEKMHLMF